MSISEPLSRLSVLATLLLAPATAQPAPTERLLLSGSGSDDTVYWEFKINGGRRADAWATIPVPSNWEMQGFGGYRYYDDWSNDPAPDSIGLYRHSFALPETWAGKTIDIVFGGSMTDTQVAINGHIVGPMHRGGFYEFRYDVTERLQPGRENLLEVEVHKFSSDESINRAERQADFWLFGGIFRPVWLEAFPSQHIERIAIDARHTGEITLNASLGGVSSATHATARIEELDGTTVGEPFSARIPNALDAVRLSNRVPDIRPWSSEWPNRYRVTVGLWDDHRLLHEVTETFGFRTVEVRAGDGLYVNGVKIQLRGVNRHSFWPTSGRTTSAALSIDDVRLMKDMNMNAVRMSHYPPDAHFLDATDELGLFVIDELAGWQAAYDSAAGEPLVRELVLRDVNHPSIILWANGNEGGWNVDLDDDFARYDPQQRTVIHPWQNFNGLNTSHYEAYDCCANWFFHGEDLILPTEFLHGLFDGGHGAGLDDWWNQMLAHPLAVGGFLWALADEGIVRADRENVIDVAGNSAPDGIVGPYREKEGSFYTIKEIWAPVYLPRSELDRLPATFDGQLRVENRYDFTSLSQVRFDWQLVDFPTPASARTQHAVAAEGTVTSPDVPPDSGGSLSVSLPEEWQSHDALRLTATDPAGREIYTWSWMIDTPTAMAERLIGPGSGSVSASDQAGVITLRTGDLSVQFDASSGQLRHVSRGARGFPLLNGPRLVAGKATPRQLVHGLDGSDYVIEARYDGDLQHIRWQLSPSGWLTLDYAYHFSGHEEAEYLGVTFDSSEAEIRALRWLGKGPYRVWKNRMKGVEFGVWRKVYNDAITGARWEYPEFKGFHADTYWAVLESDTVPITMVVASEDLFLRLFTPSEADDPRTTHVDFPPGDLSLLHGIAPIGTKFHAAEAHGPAGHTNMVRRHGQTYRGKVSFFFGELPAASNSVR
jgi:hypothetical protein